MANCPNKNLPAYQELVAQYGEWDAMLAWRKNNEQIPTVEQAADILSNVPVYRGTQKRASNITYDGKLINIQYDVPARDRRGYEGSTEEAFNRVTENGRILFLSSTNHIIRSSTSKTSDTVQGRNKERFEDYWRRLQERYTDNPSRKDILGMSFKELFNSYKRYPKSLLGIGLFIASRLSDESDSFSGRLLGKLREKGLDNTSIVIENREHESPFYWDGSYISVNIATIGKFLDMFDTPEEAIKGIELILTEEVIHAVAEKLSTEDEIQSVYDEIVESGQLKQIKRTYNFLSGYDTPDNIAHEYIRAIIQEDIFGTSTNRELKLKDRNIFKKALDFIMSVFRSNPTPTSKMVVDRIKSYVSKQQKDSSTSETGSIYLQQRSTQDILDMIYKGWVINKPILRPLTVPDSPERYVGWTTLTGNDLDEVIAGINRWIKKVAPYSKLRAYKNPKTGAMRFMDDANNEIVYQLAGTETKGAPNKNVSKQIEKFIEKLKGKIQYVPQIVVNGKVVPANAVADVISRTIQVIADNESIDTLPEEAAHIYVEWLPDSHPLKKEMLRAIMRTPEYRKTLSEYSRNTLYQINPTSKTYSEYILDMYSGKLLDNDGNPVYEDTSGISQNSLSTITNKKFGHGSTRGNMSQSMDILNSILNGTKFIGDFGKIGSEAYNTWESGKFIIVADDINPVKEDGSIDTSKIEIILNTGLSYYGQELAKKYPHVIFKDYNGKIIKPKKDSVDTNKIAIEAIGKKIASAIVGKADKIATTWWQKLWNYIRSIFSGKEIEDIWNQAASDILSANTSKLDLAAINKAAEQGRYYLQLSPEESRFYNILSARATEAQKAVIDDLIRNPSVIFQESGHKYMSVDMNDTTQYTSVTEGIGVEGPPNPQDYEANRQWGQDFDMILKGIVEHRDLNDIPATPTLTDKVREKIYLNVHKYITDKMSQGYIPLTQVSISDKLSGIAGTMDLVWVSPGGTIQVVDLKTSWNTVAGTSYWNNPHLLKDTSKIKTSDRIAITKKQQHAIQVNAYTKMLQIMGYHKVTAPVTKHYRVAHDNAGTVIDFVDESTVEHKPSEMEAAVNMLIPTQIGTQNRLEELEVENPLNTKEFQEDKEEALKEEEDIPAEPVYTEEEKRSLKDKVREVMNALKSYRDMLAARSKQRTDTNTSAIQEINDLSKSIIISLGSGNWEAGYIQFLDYANQQTAHLIGYINNPANYNATTQKGKDNYRAMVPRAQQFIKTLQGVLQVHSFVKNNPEMLKLSLTLGDLVNSAQNSIGEAYKRIVGNNIIADNTTNPLLTNSVIAEKLVKDDDIDYLDAWASDLANIGNVVLETLDKKIKLTAEEKRKEALKVKERIAEMGEKLVKVAGTRDTKVLYDIMFQRDSNGNKTGRMLSMIGDKYWKMRDEIIAPTRDLKGTGEPLQYITDPKTQEDLEYNINLSKAKKKVAEFQSPEITSYNPKTRIWSYEDGRFHYLSAEYKAERDKVMVFEGGSWIPKDGMDREVKQFRNKYMDFIPETYKMEYDNNGNPTGRVIENTDGIWYPKREHVVIRPIAADGTDMRDATWKKLRAGNTPLEKAQMEFLEEYRDILGEQVDYLGPQQRNWYQRNYIPAVASNFLQQLGNSPKRMELIMNELKEWFTVKGYATQTEIQRQTGSLSQSLPAIYTANMRSQEQLDRIVAEIAEHDAKKATLTTTRQKVEWANKAKELETLRKIELNKLTPDQIHPDLTQGLMAFTDMTHKFRVVDAISDDLIAVENVLTNMTFYEKKRDVTGKVIETIKKEGVDSRTYKRFITYVQQVWENDESMNKEMLDVIINKAMKVTSTVGMAFNWLGHAHNVFTGQINNTIDSFGDELYTRKANMRMKLEVNKAMAAKAVQAGQLLGKSYKTPPPSSKYDALVQEFNMIEHMANSDPGKVNILGDWGYGTMQLGEWVVQSRVGNAILDSIILVDPKGNEISVYDAYEFEATTGKLSIKPGYKIQSTGAEFNEKEILKIHNRIRETNKRIHGNYRDIDRTSIERYSIGKMIMQFHKWVAPAYKARFHRAKWDENLGAEGMWNEGRYRSAAAFIKGLYNKTITIEQMWKGAMEDLSKMTPEDKKKFIRDNYEGVISAEEFKNFDLKIKTIDNLIEAHKSVELLNMDTTEHRAQWLAKMEDLQNERQVIEKAVDNMMVKLMEHRKNNITKAAADLLYICILWGTFILLKGIADDLPEDDPMMKKVTNWMMWEADRNRKETSLFVPFVNLVEAYQLIKSPIPALGAVRDFGQMMNAMIQYPLQNEEERYLQRGPNEGRLKVWKETTDIIPIWRQYNRWLSFDNINNFYIK